MSHMINHLNIGLKDYQILHASNKPKLQVHVKLKSSPKPNACPFCHAKKLYSKGRYLRKVKHLESFEQPSTLVIHTHRWLCCQCRRSFISKLPGITKGKHSSEPLRKSIYKLHHQGICAKTLATSKSIGQATVARIYKQFTYRAAKERASLNCPMVLGIDEHTLHKKQKFCTTLCDLKNHRVFDIRPGRSNQDLASYFATLKGRDKVRVVCIDLSSPYRKLIQTYFPNARIVADRFHVVRIIYYYFMQLARAVAPDIKSHRGSLATMRKRPENLTDKQRIRLEELFAKHPALEKVHQNMHELRELMNQKEQTKKQCKKLAKLFAAHIHKLKYSDLKPMQTLAKTLQQWMEPIACMWRFSKNNGITEGFHRKMKLIQRRAYGFRNFENYRLRVIAQCG